MIRAVIFDLGNVIFPFDMSRAARSLAQYTTASAEEILPYIAGSELEKAFERGEKSSYEFYDAVCRRFDMTVSYEMFSASWCDIFSLNTGTEKIIRSLAGNCRLGVLSNTNTLHFSFLMQRYPVMGVFNDYHLSYKLGCRKPDAILFEKVKNHYSYAASELLFIDDIADNAAAARAAGLKALQFENADALAAMLAGMDIAGTGTERRTERSHG